MKRLLLPVLCAPAMAMAGIVIVDEAPRPVPAVASIVPLAVAVQAVKPPAILPLWRAEVGSTLRESVQKWVDAANAGKSDKWTLVWNTTEGGDRVVNYRIDAPLSFQGSLDEAVANCIRLYEDAKTPLKVDINLGQKLLYVHIKYK